MKKAQARLPNGVTIEGEVIKEEEKEREEEGGFLWLGTRIVKYKAMLILYEVITVDGKGKEMYRNKHSDWFPESDVLRIYETNQ